MSSEVRLGRLLAEAVTAARSTPLASTVLAIISAAVCLVVFATAGRSAAMEAQVVGSIDDAGTRAITMTVTQGADGMPAEVVTRVEQLLAVEWAVGLGPVQDVTNAAVPGGSPVASRTMVGDPPAELRLVAGRWPQPGEVVATLTAATSLGMRAVAGAVTPVSAENSYAIVGVVEATGSLAGLDGSVLLGTAGDETPVTTVHVLARDASSVAALAVVLRELSGKADPRDLAVTTSQVLVELGEVVSGQLGAFSRELAVGTLGAGSAFVALTMMSIVGSRRRDVGRRRALGASRSAVVLLVAVHGAVPAVAGAVIGTVAGLTLVHGMVAAVPAASFIVAVPLLAVLAALVGSLPAALAAALRDPVRILRVP